jgi:immune inhibitor A
MAPDAKQRFEKLFFSKGEIETGSVSEFYEEVSHGNVSLAGEAIGPFTLSHEKAHYGNNGFGFKTPEPNSMTMADEAVTLATGQTNFDKYDNDGNGYVRALRTNSRDHVADCSDRCVLCCSRRDRC